MSLKAWEVEATTYPRYDFQLLQVAVKDGEDQRDGSLSLVVMHW